MLSAPHVTIQCPPPLAAKPTLSKEENVSSLDDDPIMDVHNLSFDDF